MTPDATADMWREAGEELLASNTEQGHLIEALLTLATSEAGLRRREPVDLCAVIRAVLLTPRPEARRLGLHLEAATTPAVLDGDPVLTERLVANLVDNAVRHNIPDGWVQVATRTVGGRATVSVVNTGPVIPPDQVDRLFQPFHRLRSRRTSHGHGLGLSIVHAIATAHGATVTARALPQGGLAIDVTFPPPGRVAGQPRATGRRLRRVTYRRQRRRTTARATFSSPCARFQPTRVFPGKWHFPGECQYHLTEVQGHVASLFRCSCPPWRVGGRRSQL